MKDLKSCDADDLSSLYEAAFDGSFVKALGVVLGNRVQSPASFVMFTEKRGRPAAQILLETSVTAAALAAEGDERWGRTVGQIYHGHDPLGRPRGADAAVGVVLTRDGQSQTVLELRYPFPRSNQLRGPLSDLLTGLLPHVERALRIQALRVQENRESRMASGILDLLPFPTLVLGVDGVVHKLNAKAAALIGQGEALQMAADDVLHAVDPTSDNALQQVLSLMTGRHSDRARTLSVRNAGSGKRLVLTLKCLIGTDRLIIGAGLGGVRPAAELVLMVQECTAPLSISHDALWQTFAMNSKEVDLALSLLNGESIGDLASRRNVSKQTLRNQLTGILRKTETSRQSELVGLLTRLAMSPLH